MTFKHTLSKTACLAAIVGLGFVGNATADDHEETYSTEAYCLLQKENVDPRYIEAYADRLGLVPSRKTCRSFLEFAESVTPKAWDYPQGRPYPGSVIRLTKDQIEKIKAAKNSDK
ncbi:hypothetical protein [Alteromonas facilis]|uniref:hypothetical protein n=1 Tax=Alteromonas facilis TaxID=2048004 RepID=UPI001F0BC565|nr:hypothetical protein [Alteromonas facilis]